MRAEKRFKGLFWMKIWMMLLKIIKPLQHSGVLIDGVTETVNYEIKKRRQIFCALLAPLAASVVQPVLSSVVKVINGRGIRGAGGGYMNKIFSPAPSFEQYWD